MIAFDLPRAARTVLCLGAHSDDLEIGCGGTVLTLSERDPEVRFHWCVFSAEGMRADEARWAAETFLAAARHKTIEVLDFRGSYFPWIGAEIKDKFEALKAEVRPDVILTQYGGDLHQDHRALAELTWNTWRDHLVLEYEIPKYDGGLGSPNVFVPLTANVRDRKIVHVLSCFPSQTARPWFTADTFAGLMRLRGVECNAPEGSAEAFYCRKLRLAS
jgi:LmbE family N-acetylglucosaminyl deacetylase